MDITSGKGQTDSIIANDNATLSSKTKPTNSNLALAMDSGELGQIQELLFGNQLLAIDKQMDAIRQYTDQQLALVREDYAAQVASLRNRLDLELAEIAQKQRIGESDVSNRFDETVTKLEEFHIQLSSQISDVGTRLTTELETKNEAIQKRVDEAVRQLRDQKLDRAVLSTLLSDVASQLAKNAGLDNKKP